MTTISLLGGDWEYEFEDDFIAGGSNRAGLRRLNYVSGVVRATNEVYSALAEAADDFQAMGFKNPILPVTPNAYTMENQAFISRVSTEFLKEGTITADWNLVGVAGNDSGRGVLRVPYTIGVDFITSDIGREVVQAGTSDSGTLLDFEVEPDGTLVAWIRPSDSTPSTGDLFDGTGALTATGGTGATTDSTAATSGFTRFTAIQAIGSVPTATEVYLVQDRLKLANAADNTGFQFWATDQAVSLGIISVLIRTHNAAAGVAAVDGIAQADLEVFARRYTSLYDNFRLNVAAGGFSALPLASAPDINNTTGYRAGAWDAGTGSAMLVGDLITNTFAGKTGGRYVVTQVTDSGATGTFEWYDSGDLTPFANDDTFTSPNRNGTIQGAPTATAGGPTDVGAGEGGTVTITIGHTTRDHDNSGTAEPYSAIVDSQGDVAIAKVYERIKYVTRRGSDNTFWDTVSSSVPGEQYRGIEALAYYDNPTTTLVEGEDLVNETQTPQTMRLMADNSAAAGEGVGQDYVTLTDIQPSTINLANNDVLADSTSTDDVQVDTGGAGGAILSITSPKSSPFGTFTGTQIFGAQGIDFRNPGSGDAQSYILTDDLGTLRSPPNTITYTLANTRALDRLYVARDTGTDGVIEKDQFGGMTAVAVSSKTITVAGSVDGEVPAAGFVRVVETALQQEHKYFYDSRTTGASGVFTLTDITAASADAGTSDTVLDKTGGPSFITEGVAVGMLIFVTARTSTFEVVGSITADTLAIKLIYGAGGFVSGDAFTINETIQTYDTNDNLFDLILDVEEDVGTDGTPGSESNSLVKAGGTFGTVVQVRQGKVILPFEQNQDQGQGDTVVTTVRTPDTIAV